jgi:hypothetical protein
MESGMLAMSVAFASVGLALHLGLSDLGKGIGNGLYTRAAAWSAGCAVRSPRLFLRGE